MVTTQVKHPTYQDKLKNRVRDYFLVFPDGKWEHFRKTWSRAIQVPPHKFDEVHRDMQKSGAIPMIVGGKAHQFLRKDIEKEILAKHNLDQKPPVTPELPLSHTVMATPSPDYLPAPATVLPSSTQESETPMAALKEFKIKQVSTDVRNEFLKTFQKYYLLPQKEIEAKTGYKLKSSVVSYFRKKVQDGTLFDPPKARGSSLTSKPLARILTSNQAPTETPDYRAFQPITKIQIFNTINIDGYKPEEIAIFKKLAPSILAEIINPLMKFQLITYELEKDGVEVPYLEVRRIK